MKEIKKRTGLWTKTDYLYFRLGSFSTFTKKNAPLLTAVDIQKKINLFSACNYIIRKRHAHNTSNWRYLTTMATVTSGRVRSSLV